MLLDLIIQAIRPAIVWVLGLLPEFTPPDISGHLASLAPLFQFMGWANYYVPVDVLVTVGLLFATVMVYFPVFRFTVWLLAKFHIAGGK